LKYLKHHKKRKVSGTGRKDIPEIKEEYEYVRWLVVHIKRRNTTTNYVRRQLLTEEVSDPEDDDDNQKSDPNDETDPMMEDISSHSSTIPIKDGVSDKENL